MKTIIVFCFVIAAAAAAAISEEPIPILEQTQDISPDGTFTNTWKSGNGISLEEQGVLKNAGQKDEAQVIQGRVSWTSPEGETVNLVWIADENGANFQGDHLPVPPAAPEIPLAIQRSLEWNKAHPYVEPGTEKKL